LRQAAIRGIFTAALGLSVAAAGQSGETAPAPATPEETPQYETPAGSRFQFAWDALVRYDAIDLYRQAPVQNIYRWRTEVRPEVDWIASDRFRLGVRLVGNLGSDSNSTNAARFDNYRSNGVALDRAYLEARPGSFLLAGGQFQMPMRSTEMLWDHDLQVIGGAAAWRLPTGAASSVTLRGGYFYGPQRQHDDSHIFAAQAAWEIGDPARIAVDGAESYWRLTHLDRLAGHYLRQNSPGGYAPIPGYTGSSYRYDFRLIDSLARVQVGGGWRFPLALAVDWVHNFGASTAYADAVEAALRIGKEGVPGDVQIFDVYQYVDRDALVGAYNTDDWWFHTWYTGHRVGLSVTVLPQIALRPSVVFQRRQDREHYLNRYLLDLVKTF
jgi:hypothetical protein